jgi:hypothetical protein
LVDEVPWELTEGVELTPQMVLRVQGDVLGTIALARAGAGLAQTYQFEVARELAWESSSRSWRMNAASRSGVPGRGSPPRRRSLT